MSGRELNEEHCSAHQSRRNEVDGIEGLLSYRPADQWEFLLATGILVVILLMALQQRGEEISDAGGGRSPALASKWLQLKMVIRDKQDDM